MGIYSVQHDSSALTRKGRLYPTHNKLIISNLEAHKNFKLRMGNSNTQYTFFFYFFLLILFLYREQL